MDPIRASYLNVALNALPPVERLATLKEDLSKFQQDLFASMGYQADRTKRQIQEILPRLLEHELTLGPSFKVLTAVERCQNKEFDELKSKVMKWIDGFMKKLDEIKTDPEGEWVDLGGNLPANGSG